MSRARDAKRGGCVRPAANTGAPLGSRARIDAALVRCTARERQLLALLLCERMSATEAADAMGLSLARVRKVYQGLLAELNDALQGAPRRARRPRLADEAIELRRAA